MRRRGNLIESTTNGFTYNGAGDLLTLADGKGQTTTWVYDPYGRALQKTYSGGVQGWTHAYNANGWLTGHWTPGKGVVNYVYDEVGNLKTIDYPTSTDVVFGYDANNRLITMTDAVGTTAFVRNDPLGWVDPCGEFGSEIADELEEFFCELKDEQAKDSTSVLAMTVVGTVCDLAAGLGEPLRLGETAGALSATENVRVSECAWGALDEASRAAAWSGAAGAGAAKLCKLRKAAKASQASRAVRQAQEEARRDAEALVDYLQRYGKEETFKLLHASAKLPRGGERMKAVVVIWRLCRRRESTIVTCAPRFSNRWPFSQIQLQWHNEKPLVTLFSDEEGTSRGPPAVLPWEVLI